MYTNEVASKMAEVLNMELASIEDLSTKNAKTLFKDFNIII